MRESAGRRTSTRRRGAVLIVVLGLLSILTLLGLSLASSSTTSRQISRNYLYSVRAGLSARAGVEHAAANILSMNDRGTFEDPAMAYHGRPDGASSGGDYRVPLSEAAHPSYAMTMKAVAPDGTTRQVPLRFEIDGRAGGLSGFCGGGSEEAVDAYRLRVVDANSRIHLNDGLDQGNDGPGSLNLKRLLNVLGRMAGVPGAGDRILAARPAAGFRSVHELKPVLGEYFEKLRPFVTVRAWVDRSVVNPVPLSPDTAASYPVSYNDRIGVFRYACSASEAKLAFAPEHAIPGSAEHRVESLGDLNAQWIERAGRAPINVNAAPREVLGALIEGLQGWFVAGRRQKKPSDFYDGFASDPAPVEFGYLYSTEAFAATEEGTQEDNGPVRALQVADEIIACRESRQSPGCPRLDYGQAWFGGAFRTWAQFNAFCDALVAGGLLADTRPIFPTGAGSSAGQCHAQQTLASQAMADVLKANFNPNCTLNELNPDANLFLLVDKTDLICNSTEFCFGPMGIFEIESEGLVIGSAGDRAFPAGPGETMGRATVEASFRSFEVIRQTSQADFSRGTPARRNRGSLATNNDRVLECGPEPDNGQAPSECRWSGWIQLPTIGGEGRAHSPDNADEEGGEPPQQTPGGRAERGEVLHAHFSLDHNCHFHASGDRKRKALGTSKKRGNRPDPTESDPGPYGPAAQPWGRYRLSRDWDRTEIVSQQSAVAPSDLHIDGAFVEMGSAVAWDNDTATFGSSGTAAFWYKPAFHPELTGRPRTLLAFDRMATGANGRQVQWIHGVWFLPYHDAEAGGPSPSEQSRISYSIPGAWRPSVIVGGFSSRGGGTGSITPTLNHAFHPECSEAGPLANHRWIHVAYHWDLTANGNTPPQAKVWINGEQMGGTDVVAAHPSTTDPALFLEDGNPMRLGEYSESPLPRKWTADGTLDEFFLWKGDELARAQDLYTMGRYAVPDAAGSCVFTSGELKGFSRRADFRWPAANTRTATTTTSLPTVRVLGAAWSWHAESVLPTGRPAVLDHRTGRDLPVSVELEVLVDGRPVATLLDAGGSASPGVGLADEEDLRYRLRVRIEEAGADTCLLTTPVIDDVTIFTSSGAEFLSYVAPR